MESQTRLYAYIAVILAVAAAVVVIRTPLLSGQAWIPWGQWLPGTRPFRNYPVEVHYALMMVLLVVFAGLLLLYRRRSKAAR